jgi:CRP-like cAMP-binding protein
MPTLSAQRTHSPPRNRLLAAMSKADLALLQPHLQPMHLPLRHDMERPNRPIEAVYFMESGIASVVAMEANQTQVEVGLIGREGMTGIAAVLGGNQSPHATYIQSAGEGQRMTAKNLRSALDASETLRNLLLKFAHVFMVQTAHTAIANARAKIDRRLARWILMAHDRIGDDTLLLTHEFLALMLGVRRAGVTVSLQSLKRQKLIDTARNQIFMLNRKGLERMARDSYGVPEKEYRRLIG